MSRLIRSSLLTWGLTVSLASVHAAGSPLLDALRANDIKGARALLATGADANVRDDVGATALMYAALYSSDGMVRALLDAGADVNGGNAHGSTALMWAAADIRKVRLLVDRGADISARAKDGTTPLLAATLQGNAAAVRLLLERGANPRAAASDPGELLDAAYGPWISDEIRSILEGAGVPLQASGLRTPLANNLLRPQVIQKLLKAGASPKEIFPFPTMRFPILLLGSSAGDLQSVQSIIDAGADPREPGPRGLTPLMLAASAPSPNLAALRLLIDKGTDPAARDQSGRTALDWALMQGETAAAQFLRKTGVTGALPPNPPAPVASPRSPRDAVTRAITRLQPISPTFNDRTKCISCHNQSLPAMAVKQAADRGIAVDRALAQHPSRATLDLWTRSRERVVLGHCPGPGFLPAVAYGLVALDEEGTSPSFTTDAVVSCLGSRQDPEGSWTPQDIRPPLGGTTISFTALVVRGLLRYSPPGWAETTKTRVARARDFLRGAKPIDTQDESMRLVGLLWSGAPRDEITAASRRVQALQRVDGGWGQVPTMSSDAYATGQALYALRTAGLKTDSEAYRKGVRYLLRTQLEDGSWFVRSRGVPFQPYFDAGFPHGTDQFISAAATAWAAIALAATL